MDFPSKFYLEFPRKILPKKSGNLEMKEVSVKDKKRYDKLLKKNITLAWKQMLKLDAAERDFFARNPTVLRFFLILFCFRLI